jgi:superfamily II DNA or RNA helicase
MSNIDFGLEEFFDYYVNVDSQDSIYNVGFYESIVKKKEFGLNRPQRIDAFPRPGEFYPHQKFIARFLSPFTNYNRLLAFHGIGSGKTCTYVALTEYAKTLNPNIKKVLVLVKNKTLLDDAYQKIANDCTCIEKDASDKCIAGPYIENISSSESFEISKEELEKRRSKRKVNKLYEVEKFTEFAKRLQEDRSETLVDEYSNTFIIIDEAHNLRFKGIKVTSDKKKDDKKKTSDSIITKQPREKRDRYGLIHNFLHKVKGSKILLLTATPMRDDASEVVDLLNLILPSDNQLNPATFSDFFGKDDKFKDNEKVKFKRDYLLGNVSYLRSLTSNVKITNMGGVVSPLRYTKVFEQQMSDFQATVYKEAVDSDTNVMKDTKEAQIDEEAEEEDGTEKTYMWLSSRHASTFVFPDGTYNNDNWIEIYDEKGVLIPKRHERKVATIQLSKSLKEFFMEGEDTEMTQTQRMNHRLKRLKILSSKFYYIIKQVLENPKEKMFIYSQFVGGCGALLLAGCLQFFGVSRMLSQDTKNVTEGKRYIIFTSETTSSDQARMVFNSAANDDAKFCQVVIGSHIVGEGIDFKSIRKTFVLTPFFNDATIDQAIGRSIRSNSHDRLPENLRQIEVYRMVDVVPQNNVMSIDLYMYKMSEDKSIAIKSVERLLKESAVDCELNRSRNILPSDQPNTKECDYMEECNYKCDGISPNMQMPWIDHKWITDTYNLHYADQEIVMITNSIKDLFKLKNSYDFEEMFLVLIRKHPDLNYIVLARTLFQIITTNMPLFNRNGFKNYLRTDRNMYFLIDDPLAGRQYNNAYYADKPYPLMFSDNLDLELRKLIVKKSSDIIDLLQASESIEQIQKILKIVGKEFANKIIETSFVNVKLLESQTAFDKIIYSNYGGYFDEIKHKNQKYFVNLIDDKKPRFALTNQSLDCFEWNEDEELADTLGEKAAKSFDEVRKTPYKYYAVLNPSDVKTFNLRRVTPEYKTDKGLIDNRKYRPRAGTSCGTGEFNIEALIKMFLEILKVIKDRKYEFDPPFIKYINPILGENPQVNVERITTNLKAIISNKSEKSIWNKISTTNPKGSFTMKTLNEMSMYQSAVEYLKTHNIDDVVKLVDEDLQKILKFYATIDDKVEYLLDNVKFRNKLYEDEDFKRTLSQYPALKMWSYLLGIPEYLFDPSTLLPIDDKAMWREWLDANAAQWIPLIYLTIEKVYMHNSRELKQDQSKVLYEWLTALDFCQEFNNWFKTNQLFVTTVETQDNPCQPFKPSSKNVNAACLKKTWTSVGCDGDVPADYYSADMTLKQFTTKVAQSFKDYGKKCTSEERKEMTSA